MGLHQQALLRDLQSPTFRVGVQRGKWRLMGLHFPFALFFITAAPRQNGPAGFLLRSECSGYSGIAPTSQLWHGGNNAVLDVLHRPRSAQDVMVAFSAWGQCLYHPIDRLARDHWPGQFLEKQWHPHHTITFLTETVYDLLHTSEYSHANLPAEALNVPPEFVEPHPA